MAFSGSLGSRDAGTVRLTAETGQFNREVDQAERNWVDAMKSMSREALKLDDANDRLERSLHRFGAESSQARRAVIALKDAEEQAARASDRASVSQSRFHAANTRLNQGFATLRASIFSNVGAMIGGAGFVYGVHKVIDAAKNAQVILGQTSVAVTDAGVDWEKSSGKIQASALRIAKASAFDDEKVLQSFQVFVRSQKNVQESLNLSALAADVARGRYIDLETATNIVNKASLGQIGALRRLGIQIDKNATSTEALNALQQAYAGSAQKYANSAAGAADKLSVSWENLAEATGGPLLHGLALVNNALSVTIDHMDKLGQSSDVAAAKLKNPAFDAGLAALNGPGVNLKALQEQFAQATNIVAPGEGFVKTGLRRAKPGDTGKGPPQPITTLPRGLGDLLNTASMGSTSVQLSASQRVESFWRNQLALAKKGTKTYSEILSNLAAAHSVTEGLENQIAAEQDRHDAEVDRIREKALDRAKAQREAAKRRREQKEEAELKARLDDARSLSIGAQRQLLSRFPMGDERLKRIQKDAVKTAKDKAVPDFGPVLRDFMQFQHQFLTGLVSQFLGGTGPGNALQTHALEQFTLAGNSELKQQTGLLKSIAQHRGSGRGLDEALMS